MKDCATNSGKRPKRKIRFIGIVADARALKVHRATLHHALKGYPGLDRLRRRYEQLKASQVSEANSEPRKKAGTKPRQPK